ncbi:transcriptional regulator, LuxR family [Pseudarthrobacter chlorophenolicus A6]|uniref:Transcriptional regulator, LuxR family n=1 Tax=Pseudarthrobacter chlorophenolicus (strain ATCC 700700 / DSM 12829 / CIP 107037 / JCM 12360 / KCTC 9906 / NCIMB 13794 / A6) TaxID=452863 RepID=B8H843_PSECP|nr:AAA family ATPase [Pseudarthrobacter chlorophenolicus]ACL41846.1 transcriptional regulator, LuxR family [Pseudarthrobacter chlorophenolicus A6]SDQ57524.1 regulatory protein, luxR family [Pseudarthrobacter chlorophenolicus]
MSLVGRSKELDRILSVIRGPKDSALVVSGSRGAGKSALLAEISALCDYPTVFLSASASESDWPLSGITALLNRMDDPVLNRIADELLRDAAGTLNVPAFSATLLAGLLQRSSSRTVIAIDDADRLDPGSQAVIGFLARRLTGTDIALFLSARGAPPDSPFNGLESLLLNPLSYNETVRMLEAIPAKQATTAAAHAVASATPGNPLAAVELYRHLLERQADGKYAMPIPLPCRGSFETEFAAVVGRLTPSARGILDLLSLSCRTDIGALEQVSGDVWSGVDELLSEGLVSRTGPHLRIREQLLRGYVFSTMTPAARTASHRALANASESSDPYARRWHLSYTALERQTPFSLLRHGVDLIRGGDVPFAVEYVERALTLNPWEAETAARLAAIAELLFSLGEFVYARRYLDWARRVTHNPALILRLTGLAFEIQFAQGASVRSSMVLRLAKEFGRHDPAFTAGLLAGAALYYAERWELSDAAEVLRCGTGFRDAASPECLAIAERAQTLVGSIGGDATSLARKHEPAGEARALCLLVQGRALSYAERYEHAAEAFAMVRSSVEAGDTNWRECAMFLAVDNEVRAGNIRVAVRLIDELEAHEPEIKYFRGMRHLFRVWRAHALGDEALAASYATEAHRFAASENHPALSAQLAAMQGHFALLRGDLAEACAQLSRAAEIGMCFSNPTLLRCEGDLVEVLVRLNRHREATLALQRLESRSVGLRSPWLMLAVARSRAMLADGEQSLQLFARALEARTGHESILERARTLLCYAERLNAFGRIRDARDALMRAKVMFDEAGADAWTQHVDVLLLDERVEPARPQGNPAMMLLADHERALARMVARGLRNKEIAATLYVSVRTVEVRLTAIYRKLGVESRAQLTALASTKESTPAEPYVLPVL